MICIQNNFYIIIWAINCLFFISIRKTNKIVFDYFQKPKQVKKNLLQNMIVSIYVSLKIWKRRNPSLWTVLLVDVVRVFRFTNKPASVNSKNSSLLTWLDPNLGHKGIFEFIFSFYFAYFIAVECNIEMYVHARASESVLMLMEAFCCKLGSCVQQYDSQRNILHVNTPNDQRLAQIFESFFIRFYFIQSKSFQAIRK